MNIHRGWCFYSELLEWFRSSKMDLNSSQWYLQAVLTEFSLRLRVKGRKLNKTKAKRGVFKGQEEQVESWHCLRRCLREWEWKREARQEEEKEKMRLKVSIGNDFSDNDAAWDSGMVQTLFWVQYVCLFLTGLLMALSREQTLTVFSHLRESFCQLASVCP